MTTAAATPVEPNPLADLAAEAAGMLRELAQIGMGMARDLGRLAGAVVAAVPEGEPPTADQAKTAESLMGAFGRVSRSVRQSLALQAKLITDAKKIHDRAADKAAQVREAQAAAQAARRTQGTLRRAMAEEMASSAIEALEREPLETERLFEALDAALDESLRETLDGDEANASEIEVDAMALQLCATLGIDPGPDWWKTEWGMEFPRPRETRRPVAARAPP